MRLSSIVLICLFSLFFITNCQKKEDNTFRNALVLFYLKCTGGSADACKAGCSSGCGLNHGDPVTSDKFSCVNSCQDTCASNCDLSTSAAIYFANNPIGK